MKRPGIAVSTLLRIIFVAWIVVMVACSGGGGGGGSTQQIDDQNGKQPSPKAIIQAGSLTADPQNFDGAATVKFYCHICDSGASPGFFSHPIRASLISSQIYNNLSYDWTVTRGIAYFYIGGTYTDCGNNIGVSCGNDPLLEISQFPLTIQVSIRNGNELLDTASLAIELEDTAPKAEIQHSMAFYDSVEANSVVELFAGRSHDSQFGLLGTYTWELVSAPQGNTASLGRLNGLSTSLTPDTAGDYVVRLTVTEASNLKRNASATQTITVVDPGSADKLVAAMEVHTPDIDNVLSNADYEIYPYLAFASAPVTVNVAVNTTVNLNGVDSFLHPAGTTYRYELADKPQGSNVALKCSDSSACEGANSDPDRSLRIDLPGKYIVELVRVAGDAESKAASVTINAYNAMANAPPSIGDGIVYDHPNACVSKEIALPWVVDADGNDVTFSFSTASVTNSDRIGFAYFGIYGRLAGPQSLNLNHSGWFRADTTGEYLVAVVADDGMSLSEPIFVSITITDEDIAPESCYVDTDGDSLNDENDPTPNGEPANDPDPAPTSTSSCTAGSACVSFQVNRAIWGF